MKNKINVNISPNPLDLQTLHCSQNDTGERKFYFTLHNNGEVIDATDISDPIFEPFDVYKGGTEQLLPINTDEPSTSPIIADIQYPDEEKTEQEFTYRESPTTIDGKALIEKIKGNTIVWNQLAKELNATNWLAESATVSYSNGICTLTSSGFNGRISADADIIANHKYLMLGDFTNADNQPVYFYIGAVGSYSTGIRIPQTSVLTRQSKIYTATETGKIYVRNNSNTGVVTIKNLMLFDLTQMGLDITDPSEFTSLFPLSYYSYNQGTLLSFNGTGLKVTGKNLFDGAQSYTRTNAGYYIREGDTNNPLPLKLAKGTYTISIKSTVAGTSQLELFSGGTTSSDRILGPYVSLVVGVKTYTFTIDRQCDYIRLYGNFAGTISDVQIEYGSTATSYEPYKESSLSLPISQYFPTGMKSAGTVYDEFTSSRAYTRVGEVDLGSLTWTYDSAYTRFRTEGINTLIKKPSAGTEVINMICPIYESRSANDTSSSAFNNIIGVATTGNVFVRNASYSDATAFKTAMNGVMLQYELAVEEVTEFTHASLICEDGESTLYQDVDSLVCDCTEDFSKDSGFKDCKIKITNDDEVVYSNKIQLHIERKP